MELKMSERAKTNVEKLIESIDICRSCDKTVDLYRTPINGDYDDENDDDDLLDDDDFFDDDYEPDEDEDEDL
jgi:hypothetical protein